MNYTEKFKPRPITEKEFNESATIKGTMRKIKNCKIGLIVCSASLLFLMALLASIKRYDMIIILSVFLIGADITIICIMNNARKKIAKYCGFIEDYILYEATCTPSDTRETVRYDRRGPYTATVVSFEIKFTDTNNNEITKHWHTVKGGTVKLENFHYSKIMVAYDSKRDRMITMDSLGEIYGPMAASY